MPLRMYALRDSGVSGSTIGVANAQGAWWNAPFIAAYGHLTLDKNDSTLNGSSAFTGVSPNVSPNDNLNAKTYLGSWAYQLPTDMYLSGTVDLCFPISSFGLPITQWDMHWCLHAWVASAPGTGPLIRGTLINNYSEPTGTTNQLGDAKARSLIAPVTITPLQCRAGDWVVFEIGSVQLAGMTGDTNVGVTNGTKTLGGSIAPDYTPGDLSNYPDSAGATWIEFVAVPTPIPDDNSTPCDPTCAGGTTTPPPDQTPLQPWTAQCVGGGLVPTAFAPAGAEVW